MRYLLKQPQAIKQKRKTGKKVISFSLWGHNPQYTGGAFDNTCAAKTIYPDWVCRFYCDARIDPRIVYDLRDLGAEVVLIDTQRNDWIGLSWRFKVFLDPTVHKFIVRDTDSIINLREQEAVRSWVDSGVAFHIMRDNPTGHNYSIMPGMFGGTVGALPEIKEFLEILDTKDSKYWSDVRSEYSQDGLVDWLWGRVKDRHIAHDNYFKFTGKEKRFTVVCPEGHVGQKRNPSIWVKEKYPYLWNL